MDDDGRSLVVNLDAVAVLLMIEDEDDGVTPKPTLGVDGGPLMQERAKSRRLFILSRQFLKPSDDPDGQWPGIGVQQG